MTTLYMNEKTGSTDTRDGWFYTNEQGAEVNAVDLGEVVEVKTQDQLLSEFLGQHNSLVKDDYKVSENWLIESWLFAEANVHDQYIEIPGNECICGHAVIIDLEPYISLFDQ